jgi:hypothetical protein
MKLITYFAAATALLISSACSEYLKVFPENSISSEEYLSREKDMELYCNGFLQSYQPDEGIPFSDENSDYMINRNVNTFLDGDTYRPEQQGNWETSRWGILRRINWYLDKLPRGKHNVSEEVYNHYEGVGRFWRTRFYVGQVQMFGDVPWYDHEVQVDDYESLYKTRDSREFVMDKVLEDLNFASTYCSTATSEVNSSTKVTRWVALAWKARVCLFEGTYRKYHTELGLTASAERFLREAADACDKLMRESPYSLVTSGDVKTQYRLLFTSENLNQKEVIWGAAYKDVIRYNSLTKDSFNGSTSNGRSFIKQFINQFLMLDGSRFTDRAGYETVRYEDEFTNRDWRLSQIIISPGYVKTIGGVPRAYPPNWSVTKSGYMPIKWCFDNDKYDDGKSFNSIPIFRFAEALLIYAEAKAELGEMDNAIWDRTIRLLRERAGVNGNAPAAYDPYLATYYLNQTTDKWILEVRRERSIEMAMEDVRYDDLMRWKLGKLIEIPKYGIYIGALDTPYDLNSDGITDLTVSRTGNQSINRVVIKTEENFALKDGDHGYLLYGITHNKLWLDKKYLRPIPRAALDFNPNLGQNPGWD